MPKTSKKYVVCLTEAERQTLQHVVAKFKGTSRKVRRAQVLLKSDADGPDWRQRVKDRRFGAIQESRSETAAWRQRSNARQRGVDWQFKVGDARVKLKSVYPKIIV